MPSSAQSSQVPDFIDDRVITFGGAPVEYSDEDYEFFRQWGDYAARQQSTTHFLERCLHK